jgi:hypothetical protein
LLEPPGTPAPPDKRDPDTTPPEVRKVTSWGRTGSNLTLMQHGFTVMQRKGTLWTATLFNRDGNRAAACQFSEALAATSSDSTKCELLVKQASSG